MCARLLRPLTFGAVVLIWGMSAEAQQPEREPPPGVLSPFRMRTPVPNQPAAPAPFRFEQPRDQRTPFGMPAPREGMPLRGQPAPGTPAPNPWDLLRLWVPEPETWGPRASRRDVAPREPPEPTAEQLARLTNGQLRTLLEAAASSLSTDLDRLKTGDNWKKYLELAKLQQEFSDDARQQLDRAVADGMKFGDLTVAEGIKRGDLTIVAGVKLRFVRCEGDEVRRFDSCGWDQTRGFDSCRRDETRRFDTCKRG